MDKQRIILLNGEINDKSAMEVIIQLLMFDKLSNDEIVLYINSPGGSITSGLAIYDVMNYIKSPCSTICYGSAASMGAFLLSCGKKGRRFILRHSRVLIHQPLIYAPSTMYKSQSSMEKIA